MMLASLCMLCLNSVAQTVLVSVYFVHIDESLGVDLLVVVDKGTVDFEIFNLVL